MDATISRGRLRPRSGLCSRCSALQPSINGTPSLRTVTRCRPTAWPARLFPGSIATLDRCSVPHARRRAAIGKTPGRVRCEWAGIDSAPKPRAKRASLDRAAQPMQTELGTLDAIHLAIALLWKDKSRVDLVMAAHDDAMGPGAQAHARTLGRGCAVA